MKLSERLGKLAQQHWRPVFTQARTMQRAVRYGVGLLLAVGRRTASSSILARGLGDRDWSADYKMFSRSEWDGLELFGAARATFLDRYPEGLIPVALDDTKTHKTGLKIPHVSWQRDPLSPPFATNFIRAQRFVQAALLFPHHKEHELSARGVPIAFEHAPALKRPGHRATDEERAKYRLDQKQNNLSTQSLALMKNLRRQFDRDGAEERTMAFALDGSFCNKTIFTSDLERTILIARARKDAKLCFPAPSDSRRWYDTHTFTPDGIRTDESIPYETIKLRLGHVLHEVRYKEVSGVLWRTGAKRRSLRLIVVAPQPYRVHGTRTLYRQPAYLLTNDLTTSAATLIQIYIDRWQIEVNHREEKDLLGLGQVQAWSVRGAERHPTFTVALYSLLLTAAIIEFGPTRTSEFSTLPRWRRKSLRPSLLDLLRLLRKECSEVQNSLLFFPTTPSILLQAANG